MCLSFVPPSKPSPALPSPSAGSSSSSNSKDTTPTKNAAQHLTLLHDVIKTQRWSAFENIVLSNPSIFRAVSDAMPKCDEFDGMSLLHATLRYDPPVKVVLKMMKLFSSDRSTSKSLQARDSMGRTPLHIAADSNADPLIIKLLSSLDSSTCTMLDCDGRTPLHLLCDTSSNENDTPSRLPHQQCNAPSYEAVCALLSESLEAASIEDEDDMSALEYAILSDAPMEVVELLQKATMQSLQEKDTKKRPLVKHAVVSSEEENVHSSVKRRRVSA